MKKPAIAYLALPVCFAATHAFAAMHENGSHSHHGQDHSGHSGYHNPNHHSAPAVKDGVTVGGIIDFQAAGVDQDLDAGMHDYFFNNDTELHITFRDTTASGLVYGAMVELEADVTEDFRDEGLNADKTYLFLESSIGRLELGAVDDVGHRLGVDASTFARATGGIHGDWFRYTVFPGGGGHAAHGSFLHFPTLPLHHMHGAAEDANKFSYYSPGLKMRGAGEFRAGVSYMPDTGASGSQLSPKDGHRDFNDVVNGGVNYSSILGAVGYTVSAIGEMGRAELPGHENLRAYALGAVANWRWLQFGGSWGNWSQSVTHTVPDNPDGRYYSLGLGAYMGQWGLGPWGASLGWFEGTYQHNTVCTLSLGADYTLAPGLTPYAEVNFVSLDMTDPAVQDNDATVVILGTLLSF